jgi:cytochrome c-type biogenesis protein CcsB
LTDAERQTRTPFRIYMNNILKYRGYRFFQSSYDQDERGTILSVSHDFWGTFISYAGYLFMLLGMVLTLFNKNSRFRTLVQLSGEVQKKRKSAKTLLLLFLLGVSAGAQASDDYVSQKDHLSQLEELLIQDGVQGRIEPLNTYSSDLLRKIAKETSYGKTSATAVFLGMCTDSEHWKNEPIIKVSDPKLGKELGAVNGYVTFNQMFDFDNDGQYRLSELVEKTYQKAPATRNKYDKEVINVDERVNICYEVFTGNLLNLFPEPGGKDKRWRTASKVGVVDASTSGCPMHSMTGDSTTQTTPIIQKSGPNETAYLLDAYFRAVLEAQKSGNWKHAVDCLSGIKDYQFKNGGELLPSMSKIRLEILYNNLNLFGKLAILYALLGFLLLVLHLVNIFRFEGSLDRFLKKCTYLYILVFAVYSLGLGIRWYVSGHAPWSNGYETIVFVGWATGLSGLAFVRRSPITLAVTSLLSAIALFVAGMSWMNPEITNLVPVLKSYWLVLHVAVITSSYGFFAMAALMGLLNLFLMMSRSKKNVTRLNESVREFSYIIEMALYIGLVMLSVGTFLGAVWANESWGRYWGWDPKETWALVSILVYAIVLHLRKVPALNNQLVLSTMALLSFSTVLMTFFGVNYYLSGMHSYAQGTPPPVPAALYIVLIGVLVVLVLAIRSERIVQGWIKGNKK